MPNQEEVNRVREKIARTLADQTLSDRELDTEEKVWEWVIKNDFGNEYYDKADQILSIKTGNKTLLELIEGYENGTLLEKAKDQSLSKHAQYNGFEETYGRRPKDIVFAMGQKFREQDMLKPDKNGDYFVKVIGGK